jgi:hypothetical protein
MHAIFQNNAREIHTGRKKIAIALIIVLIVLIIIEEIGISKNDQIILISLISKKVRLISFDFAKLQRLFIRVCSMYITDL